ncbi:hypothetical protein GQ457_07G009330 [Hibiscus cannabinus]
MEVDGSKSSEIHRESSPPADSPVGVRRICSLSSPSGHRRRSHAPPRAASTSGRAPGSRLGAPSFPYNRATLDPRLRCTQPSMQLTAPDSAPRFGCSFQSYDILRCHVMRIAGDRVLLIFYDVEEHSRMLATDSQSKWFRRVVEWNKEDCEMGCRRTWIFVFGVLIHAWFWETFEQVISHWGNLIPVAEETLEPSSFEKGLVLIEMKVLDRIEEQLELVVDSQRVEMGGVDSKSGEGDAVERPSAIFAWREKKLWEGHKDVSRSSSAGCYGVATAPAPALVHGDSTVIWVTVPITDGVEVQSGPAVSGSTTKILFCNGNKKKVCILIDVIRSTLSLQEKLLTDKQVRKGKGRPRKTVVPSSSIADILLSDADFQCQQSVILREVNSTVEFGKFLGIKRKVIKSFLWKQRVEMRFLVETKLELVSDDVVKSIWLMGVFRYEFVPSLGSSGGILVIWELTKFDLVDIFHDSNFLHLRGTWCLEAWECDRVSVYAPCVSGAVLASRLQAILGALVSDSQSAFLQGRQISDGILLVNRVVHSLSRKSCPGDSGADGVWFEMVSLDENVCEFGKIGGAT